MMRFTINTNYHGGQVQVITPHGIVVPWQPRHAWALSVCLWWEPHTSIVAHFCLN
jgi:hypothetical protein